MHKKDKKEEELEKLETGFNTYVNGAHKKNEKYTPRYTITKTSSATNSCSSRHFTNSKFNIPINLESLCSSRNSSANVTPATTSRKKWGNSSFIFKTTDGCEIKISSPNHYKKNDSEPKKTLNSNETITSNECEYSDDFESDEDTNANKKKTLDENLIETVKFSSDEEDTTEITSNKKNFVFKLTKNDVKLLRQSFNQLNESIKSDESLNKIEKSDQEIDSDCEKNKLEPSSICNVILEKASLLKRKDRENLIDFLSKIDE